MTDEDRPLNVKPLAESSMDPEDWSRFRELAHEILDNTLDSLETIAERPAWQPVPDAVKATFDGPVPREGVGEEEAYRRFRETIEPYTIGNRHPGFYGWVQAGGTPLGVIADMLAASLNPHGAGFDQSSTYVELQVLEWLRELMGLPEGSSGVLVSGGSMANFIGLAAARDEALAWHDDDGDSGDLTLYASREVHGWAPKAAHLLGLGASSYRSIDVDAESRIDLGALESTICEDRSSGRAPFCVIATAGTVSTGATDDLEALADLCAREKLWLHVDGAFGAWARISSTRPELVRGIERADSLAFDLHKWGYLPFEVACALVRDAAAHRRPFAISGSYLEVPERGTLSAGLPFAERGIELTRQFRALKVWLSFVAYGTERLARQIDQNVRQAEHLRDLVDADSKLERLAPVPLNIVVFRYRDDELDAKQLDELNNEILLRVQESGIAVPSSTRIDGRFGIRACFVNHRTTLTDVERLANLVRHLGDELTMTS